MDGRSVIAKSTSFERERSPERHDGRRESGLTRAVVLRHDFVSFPGVCIVVKTSKTTYTLATCSCCACVDVSRAISRTR